MDVKILNETISHIQGFMDIFKIATGLKMARAAVGWSQVELAQKLGMAKTTLARAETAEGGLRADQLAQIIRLYKELGVELDLFSDEAVRVQIDRRGLEIAMARLQSDEHRRADRKRGEVLVTIGRGLTVKAEYVPLSEPGEQAVKPPESMAGKD